MIPKFSQITDLFFDLDHTLYDFDKNAALTFANVFADLQLEKTERFMTHFRPINEKYWSLYAKGEITQDALRYGRLKDTFQVMDFLVTDEQIHHIADYFIQNLTQHHHVFEGAHETLDILQKKYRLHIITNGPEVVQQKKMKNSGLDKYFTTITNSEMAGVKKPDIRIFEYALNQAQVKADQSLMIGDSLEADVQGAIGAGLQVIWYNEFDSENLMQVPQVNTLPELLDLL